MGVVTSSTKSAWKRLTKPAEFRVLFVGIDGVGKTQLLYRLLGKQTTVGPTQGFNLEVLECQNASIVCWDLGHTEALTHGKLHHHMHDTQGVVFVVDSSAHHRIIDSRTFLRTFLSDYRQHFANTVFMVFANKQDMMASAPLDQLIQTLDVHSILNGFKWFCRGGSAHTGDGIHEALQLFVRVMSGEPVDTAPGLGAITLSVDLTTDEERGALCVVANMAGEEVLNIATPHSYTVADLRDRLRKSLRKRDDQLILVSQGGHTLQIQDSACSLREVLEIDKLPVPGKKRWLGCSWCLRRRSIAVVTRCAKWNEKF